MGHDAPEDPPLKLQPLDAAKDAQRRAMQLAAAQHLNRGPRYRDPLPPPERVVWSLRGMFVFVAGAAFALALARNTSPPAFAGLCGVATLVYPLVVFFGGIQHPAAQAGWWGLIAIYILSIAQAIVTQRPV